MWRAAHQFLELIRRYRFREQVALSIVAPGKGKQVALRFLFYSFRAHAKLNKFLIPVWRDRVSCREKAAFAIPAGLPGSRWPDSQRYKPLAICPIKA